MLHFLVPKFFVNQAANVFYCLATLSDKPPWATPFGKKEEVAAKKSEFAIANSDHLTNARVYNAYFEAAKNGHQAAYLFCSENYVSSKTIQVYFLAVKVTIIFLVIFFFIF